MEFKMYPTDNCNKTKKNYWVFMFIIFIASGTYKNIIPTTTNTNKINVNVFLKIK